MAKISVLILAKNEEKNIGDCITSCSFAEDILVIDDGSTDNTLNILKSLPNIIVLTKENGGPASARRYGLKVPMDIFYRCR